MFLKLLASVVSLELICCHAASFTFDLIAVNHYRSDSQFLQELGVRITSISEWFPSLEEFPISL